MSKPILHKMCWIDVLVFKFEHWLYFFKFAKKQENQWCNQNYWTPTKVLTATGFIRIDCSHEVVIGAFFGIWCDGRACSWFVRFLQQIVDAHVGFTHAIEVCMFIGKIATPKCTCIQNDVTNSNVWNILLKN